MLCKARDTWNLVKACWLCEPGTRARQPMSRLVSPRGLHMVSSCCVPRPMYTLSTCTPVKAS